MTINVEEAGILLPQIKQKVQEAVDISNSSNNHLMQVTSTNLLTMLGTLSDPEGAIELAKILEVFVKKRLAECNAPKQ